MYEQLARQLEQARDKAIARAKYQADKSAEAASYFQGERDGFIQALSMIEKLKGEVA